MQDPLNCTSTRITTHIYKTSFNLKLSVFELLLYRHQYYPRYKTNIIATTNGQHDVVNDVMTDIQVVIPIKVLMSR